MLWEIIGKKISEWHDSHFEESEFVHQFWAGPMDGLSDGSVDVEANCFQQNEKERLCSGSLTGWVISFPDRLRGDSDGKSVKKLAM